MGGNTSSLPAPPANFPYFCIVFRISDKLKVILADSDTVALVQSVAINKWPFGVQSAGYDESGVFEIKLSGNPFFKTSSKEEAVAAKALCCHLLSVLNQHGWEMIVNSDLSRTQDLSTWFFQRNPVISKVL